MATQIYDAEVTQALEAMQASALGPAPRTVMVDGTPREVAYPFPSPADWRDSWIYFVMIDRFANPDAPPASGQEGWNRKYGFRQGGTLRGIRQALPYIEGLGARAIWLSPVLKNPRPAEWEYNYHGYATQDFLTLDARLASDGTVATAERELRDLVAEAHARGLWVILDIVLNHAARVFDYEYAGTVVDSFSDPSVMDAPLGQEPNIEWLNGLGFARGDWRNTLPQVAALGEDDAVWPADLQRREFFRRRGNKLTDNPPAGSFVRGDFGSMRQLVVEYDAGVEGQEDLRAVYGPAPVLSILIRAYQYLIARFDIDGFRIDTVKYVDPKMIEVFGNAIREYAQSVGKRNFFTFGEVYDNETTIDRFVGRNSAGGEGYGIDAALDFPLFYALPAVAKGLCPVETVRGVYDTRKAAEQGRLSSHGEAGQYFVSFLDNHDQHERFNHPDARPEQISLGLTALFCLQGVPCVYYGTEQGLHGTVDSQGNPALDSLESVREALWGKQPTGFDTVHPLYATVRAVSDLRLAEPALRYGRLYFREVSGNGSDFGHSMGTGGILAFSRVLGDREVLTILNTSSTAPFSGYVLLDLDLSRKHANVRNLYCNVAKKAPGSVQIKAARIFGQDGSAAQAQVACLLVDLKPMEAQVWGPA